MKAVTVEVPEHFLQERRDRGDDRRDEMWEGVLHLVPQPLSRHQRLGADLLFALTPAARARGLVGAYESQLYRPDFEDTDYRVPDLVYATEENWTRRGIAARAELVIEIRSPGDESFAKIPFYAEMRCQEVLIIGRDTLALDLFVRGERRPAADTYDLASLGVRIARVDGPHLHVTWQDETAVITPSPT
jgi:Uma2 family endonuclease